MATNWEDVQKDMYFEQQFEEFEKIVKIQNTEKVKNFIIQGYQNSEEVTCNIFCEFKNLENSDHPRSKCLLLCTLLETIEREVISLPLLASGFGLDANDPKIHQLKKMISIEPPKITFRFFEDNHANPTSVKNAFDKNVNPFSNNSVFFRTENNLWTYREKVQGFRNYLAHGRVSANSFEAQYIEIFSNSWRDLVFNSILSKYNLKLDPNWSLL